MLPERRSQETRRRFAGELKRLMAGKPLDKISIRELCEGCGVNRQTFYYHFADIYDLVRWLYEDEVLSLLRRHEGMLLWQDGLRDLFHYLDANRDTCLCVLRSLGYHHLKAFLHQDVEDIIHSAVFSLGTGLPFFEAAQGEFLTAFYTSAMVGLLEGYLLRTLPQSAEELIAALDQVIQDQLRGAELRGPGVLPSP